MHPWAADPETIGALAATQLAIFASREREEKKLCPFSAFPSSSKHAHCTSRRGTVHGTLHQISWFVSTKCPSPARRGAAP